MDRRMLLRLFSGVAAVGLLPGRGVAASAFKSKHKPDWAALRAQLRTRLLKISSPLDACKREAGRGADALFRKVKNPYYLSGEPSLTQTFGWIDGWTSRPSDYAVAAETASDVAAAVRFARTNGIRPVIKGGGHSYFGNSNAAGSLLIWTQRMRSIELHDNFIPYGATSNIKGVSAVSIGAGALWGEVYRKVAADGGKYVQGGGCLTVGVAGFVQGGGFGSFSKTFSTGAANLLEAEVVTADGAIRVVNAQSEPELFYALKGGGGGTFGVVTRLTLKTHPLPTAIGAILFSVKAASDTAWQALIAKVIDFYADTLFVPEWGEQLSFKPGRVMSVAMLCHGLGAEEINAIWSPLLDWIKARSPDYAVADEPLVLSVPARRFWDPAFLRTMPGIVLADDQPGASANNLYWATNRGEAGQVLNAYQSAWLPAELLRPERRSALVDALVAASSHWSVGLHTNKGLAGGSPAAIEAARQTATNPEVLTAFALLICAAESDPAWPGIPGYEPDVEKGRAEAARVSLAMAPIRDLVPNAGSYVSEADYFGTRWQSSYWGSNYSRLLAAKLKYDPDNLFTGHHCVGQIET